MVRSWPVRTIDSSDREGAIERYAVWANAPVAGIVVPRSAQTTKDRCIRGSFSACMALNTASTMVRAPGADGIGLVLLLFRRGGYRFTAAIELACGRGLEECDGGHRSRLRRAPVHGRQQRHDFAKRRPRRSRALAEIPRCILCLAHIHPEGPVQHVVRQQVQCPIHPFSTPIALNPDFPF